MQNLFRQEDASKRLKKTIWDGLELHLGRVWDGLGPLVALFRALEGLLGAL